MSSIMKATMGTQANELRRLQADTGGVDAVADRIAGRRVFLIGTGTSWHAANQGAFFLRRAHLQAWPVPANLFVHDDFGLTSDDVVVIMTHKGTKHYTTDGLEKARRLGVPTVSISGIGVKDADLETVTIERSAAYTASHITALFRLAQIAQRLGADLGQLEAVPAAVDAALRDDATVVNPPRRLLEFIGGGINQWTAAEAALKVRETSYVATEGLDVEQFLHGPSVAIRDSDALVCVDGGGPWTARIDSIADAAQKSGVAVHTISCQELGEPLSIFALTVSVQRIALAMAEQLGTNPDSFARDVPGREAWTALEL